MITVAELQVGLFEFVRNEMIPHLEGTTIPFIGGIRLPISKELMQIGFGTFTAVADLNIEKYLPALKTFGLVSENGQIDIDKLVPILKAEVQKVGSFKVGDFTFKEADIDTLVSYMK